MMPGKNTLQIPTFTERVETGVKQAENINDGVQTSSQNFREWAPGTGILS